MSGRRDLSKEEDKKEGKEKDDDQFEFHKWYKQDLDAFSISPVKILEYPHSYAISMRNTYYQRYIKNNKNNILNEVDKTCLADLECSISREMALMKAEQYFVRLVSRSPKDAAYFDKSIFELTRKEKGNDMRALWYTLFMGLKVESGQEAVELLIRSERVYQDLLALPSTGPLQLVIRTWSNIDPEREFRAFVYNGALTAISQYNEYIFVPDLISQRCEIKQAITQFFEKIKPFLPSALSCIMDLAVSQDMQNVLLVELNPFSKQTGAALFNWNRDWSVLTDSTTLDPEFRLVERVHENEEIMIDVLLDQYDKFHSTPLSQPDKSF